MRKNRVDDDKEVLAQLARLVFNRQEKVGFQSKSKEQVVVKTEK